MSDSGQKATRSLFGRLLRSKTFWLAFAAALLLGLVLILHLRDAAEVTPFVYPVY